MSRNVEFSVVIPTYNRVEFLKQAISSVWKQTHADYEIIVVDDGSTDGTVDYLVSLGDMIKVLRQEHRGPAAARNVGVGQAVGTYVAFLDSDDFWFPWTLAVLHRVLQGHDQPSLIGTATVEFQGNVPDIKQEEFVSQYFTDFLQTASDPAYVGSGALVVRRDIFTLVSGFDETMSVGEDLDFYFRAGTIRDFVRVVSPVMLAYRRHSGNMSIAVFPLYSAALELLKRERNGCYPGEGTRRTERWKLLSRMVRPVTLSCLKSELRSEALQLFWKSFVMNVRLGRFRFLTGFAFHMLFGCRAAGYLHRDSPELAPVQPK
jgi:glycosyltransferase involved in cell wall biosynthesis